MSGVIVKFSGKRQWDEIDYSFTVQSSLGLLEEMPGENLPLQSGDEIFVDLARYVSDPDIDTDLIVRAGQTLLERLKTHPNTNGALVPALNANATHPDRNIKLCFPPYAKGEILNLPWETLYDPAEGFLDIDKGLPVLRVLPPKNNATQPRAKLAEDGLRISSVIAAKGIDGLNEYTGLVGALESYGKPWTLHVYSPDQTVIDAIAARGAANVVHLQVPSSSSALMSDIMQFEPQICHFFCHGVSIGDSPAQLELATRLSQVGRPTVEVKPGELAAALPSSAWIVLLNACNSGNEPGQSGSLAASLVAEGVPVVVGMREPVQTRTINTFTQAFLDRALASIDDLLSRDAPTELNLGPSLTAARSAICADFRKHDGNPAERMKDWSLPVMMVAAAPFEVAPTKGRDIDFLRIAALESQRGELVAFRDRMAGTLAPEQKAELNAKIATIDQEIQEVLA